MDVRGWRLRPLTLSLAVAITRAFGTRMAVLVFLDLIDGHHGDGNL